MEHELGLIYITSLFIIGISLFILISIIHIRFGLDLRKQKYWAFIAVFGLIIGLFTILILYRTEASILMSVLQLGTLATFFSFIAAYGVIIQLSRKPYVFSTVNPALSEELTIVNLVGELDEEIEIFGCNLSHLTAKEIMVQGYLPVEMKVVSIGAPVFTYINSSGSLFELHMDSDKSFNPLHPKQHFSFKVKIKTEETDNIMPIVLATFAKDLTMIRHTVICVKNKEEFKFSALDKKTKKELGPLPKADLRIKLYKYQRILTLIFITFSLLPLFISLF